jgi:hypothetical protein
MFPEPEKPVATRGVVPLVVTVFVESGSQSVPSLRWFCPLLQAVRHEHRPPGAHDAVAPPVGAQTLVAPPVPVTQHTCCGAPHVQLPPAQTRFALSQVLPVQHGWS